MRSITPPHPQNRGLWNELHQAVATGSERTVADLISDGSIDIDQGDHKRRSPLLIASAMSRSHVARILLEKGASVSNVDDAGFTALHMSADRGNLAITEMLVAAGADLEATDATRGATPLFLAAEKGLSGVMSALIKAGADIDSRRLDGATPLFVAAQEGHMDAVKMLLSAKANPLSVVKDPATGATYTPLLVAALNRDSEVVRELVQQLGIEGNGGEEVGAFALSLAAGNLDVETLAVLLDAGVVDIGQALTIACGFDGEACVKILLQQVEGGASGDNSYVNYRDGDGETPLLGAIVHSPSRRLVRLLVDAGANTTSARPLPSVKGRVLPNESPLAAATRMLRGKKVDGKDATEKQLHKLERIRRLLLRVEAVHATSFLWPSEKSFVAPTAESKGKSKTAPSPLRMMLPLLRRRAGARHVLLATLFRHSHKTS